MQNNPVQEAILFLQAMEPGGGDGDIFYLASD